MKFFNKITVFFFFSAAIVAGCEHDDAPDGPNLVDRFGPFTVLDTLTASRDSVDFSAGESISFGAEFNKNVNWIIKIEGMESGAVKFVDDFDRFVNTENAVWEGGTTELPFFTTEDCLVTISVPDEDEQYGDTLQVTVTGLKVYEGTLMTDFEDPPGSDILVQNFQFELNLAESGRRDASVIPPAQGEFSLVLTGSDNAQDPFVGLIEVYSALAGNTYLQLPSNNPEEIFFNCFIYGDGRPHAIAILEVIADANDNGQFNDGQDAAFSSGPMPVTWTGWQQYSISLADLGVTDSEDVDRILLMRAILINDIANNPNQPGPPDEIQFGVDYVTFTQGGPLQL